MILKSIKYKQFEGHPKEWFIEDLQLQNINLIVGKNTAGKSKTLNVLNGLSNVLTNSKLPYSEGNFETVFYNGTQKFYFQIEYKNNKILKEKLLIDDVIFLERGINGIGKIKGIKVNDFIDFKIPEDELASNRRDEIQHPFLEPLYEWAKNIIIFRFNSELGKNILGVKKDTKFDDKDFNLRDTQKVIEIFARGKTKYGDTFLKKIINDFNSIGYEISEIKIDALTSIVIETDIPAEIVGLCVQENERAGLTDQQDMSMGMFRALTIIIHFVFYELEKISACILIDDIGEGLDFERSTKLIQLLIEKAKISNVQLIMSTNDRFVMNNVDLEYWQIIKRKASKVKYFNMINSKKTFDDFKYTGLNNFDFFATDFFESGFQEEV